MFVSVCILEQQTWNSHSATVFLGFRWGEKEKEKEKYGNERMLQLEPFSRAHIHIDIDLL